MRKTALTPHELFAQVIAAGAGLRTTAATVETAYSALRAHLTVHYPDLDFPFYFFYITSLLTRFRESSRWDKTLLEIYINPSYSQGSSTLHSRASFGSPSSR